MAISVSRGSQFRRPPVSRRGYWMPSIASLAFTAAVGLLLMLQTLAITPERHQPPPATTAATGSNLLSQPALLPVVSQTTTRQEPGANRTAALSAALPGFTGSLPGYSSPAPATMEPLAEAVAQTSAPLVEAVASSRSASAPEVTATPAPAAGMQGCQDYGPLYCVYEVRAGDTLASIARAAGLVSTEDIAGFDLLVASNKAVLNSSADVLEAGEKLRIPLQQGIIHTVVAQETLGEIASRYGVTADAIVGVAANQLSDRNTLRAGAEIFVPDPKKLGRAVAVPGARASASAGGSLLSWPAVGGITSYFGPSHPLGIDIALMPGDPVTAAASGTVTFAGGDPCCSYGLFVIIDHGNGLHTLYGHLSVIYVKQGERVDRGERIGLGGYTGSGTGPHLHFEVHVGTMLADPLTYLP